MFKEYDTTQQQSLFDASAWMNERTKKLLDKSWAPMVYEHVYTQIDERPFSVLYNETMGAPNFPVRILLTLEIIKHMFDLSDIELMEKYNFDYLVHRALGMQALGEKPLAERTLYYFRERLYLHTKKHPEEEDLIFGQFKELTQAMCKNANLTLNEQRIDTTQFMSNIKKAGRVSLACDVLVKGAKKIPESQQTDLTRAILSPNFKRDIIYRAKSSQTESKLTQLLRYCAELLAELEQLSGIDADEEKHIIRRLLDEQGVTDEEGEVSARDGKTVSAKSMQSAYDEEATYRRKNGVGHTGYVASITETCADENPCQMITDYYVAPNATSDVEILNERIEAISEAECQTLYADGGFYAGDTVKRASEEDIEMCYTNMTGKSEESDRLTADDFVFTESSDAVLWCPGGNAPEYNTVSENYVSAHFSKTVCEQCPLREHCPLKPQVKSNVIRFSKEQIFASEERKTMKENVSVNTGKRAAIEGTNSALKRTGLSKLRVRGKTKCALVCGLKVLAQNVKRFAKLIHGFYKPDVQGRSASLCTQS